MPFHILPTQVMVISLCLFLMASRALAAEHATSPGYSFAGADPEALKLYRRGWIEILEYGRWTEAERLYRETLRVDPGFTVAKSVLARITLDARERKALYTEVDAAMDTVDDDERLLLTTYQQTLELFAHREGGEPLPEDYREAMARRAVSDYGAFLERHPGEWPVMIEYIEWVHSLEGPEAAIREINRLREEAKSELSFSYFEAYFHAESGDLATANDLAACFEARVNDETSPQPHYLRAYIAFEAGNLTRAEDAIEKALALDSRHLIASRLQNQIAAASRRDND